MDAINRKRRGGFIKGKLMAFSRSSNKPSTTNVQYNSKVKPFSQSLVHHQDYGFSTQVPKVSFVNVAENNNRDKLNKFERVFASVPIDESVDLKATSYITSVQERFKLEGINHHALEMRN
ncbi:hypothetical protein ACFE04_009670 [Oxalis oulophora]